MTGLLMLHCEGGHRWYERHADVAMVDVSFTGVLITLPWTTRQYMTYRVRCPYCMRRAYYSRRHEPEYVQDVKTRRRGKRQKQWT